MHACMPAIVPMDIMTPLAMAIPAAMAVAIHACGLLAVAVAAMRPRIPTVTRICPVDGIMVDCS